MRMNGISNHTEYHQDSRTAANILMLKEKIIATDQLIRSYHSERETNEKHANEVKELMKTVDQLNKECMKYECQLSENMRELQPYKESVKELQEQNSKHVQQINDLRNKLAAEEKLTQQYEALLKSKEEQKDQHYIEKEEVDKQIGKREKEINVVKERLNKANQKLHEKAVRTQKLVKSYRTSAKHVLKFGKKLSKQKNLSKVDQKIIDYYHNIISREKNSNENDDSILDMVLLSEENEESHTEVSDNSFEVVEERITSSPYKRTPAKGSDEFCSPSPKQKSGESAVMATEYSLGDISPIEPLQLSTNCSAEVLERPVDSEMAENTEPADCMPIINYTYPEAAYSNSEKSFVGDAECRDDQVEPECPKNITKEKSDFIKVEQQESILSRKDVAWDETDDVDSSHKEMEEEIARITFDMCCQGAHFLPLSPLPPTPPPPNRASTNITADYTANEIPRKRRKLNFDDANICDESSVFDGAAEYTNGTQKLHHQQSQGFEVVPDDTDDPNPSESDRHSQAEQHQDQSTATNSTTGSHFNAPPPTRQNPEPTLEQPFQANILHCPVDGNFKINIRMANNPNEKKDHKITSLNLEVNSVTREFNISCSKIPCEYKNSITESANCPCCISNFREQISTVNQIRETSSFKQNNLVQMDTSCHPPRDKTKFTASSPLKSLCDTPETYQSRKHLEKHDKAQNISTNEEFYSIPSSDVDSALIQQPTVSGYDGSQKINVNRGSSGDNTGSYTHPVPKVLEVFSSRQKVQNVSRVEQMQSSFQTIPCTEFIKSPKKSCNVESTPCIEQIKISPANKESDIQNAPCIKQTKPALSRQKNVLCTTSLKKQKNNKNTEVASAEKSFPIAKKDVVEIFPITRKITNISTKRLLSDTSNEVSAVSKTKKCKLNRKLNETPVGYDSTVDHYFKLGRNIYDVKSSIPKTMEEIQRLKQGPSVNKSSLRKLQLKLANPHHILSTDTFVQSALVFMANTQKNPFIAFSALVSSPPLLTDFEKNLIAVLQFLETKQYSHLKNLTYGLKIALSACIFSKNKQNTLFGSASMCRTYIALCRQHGELEQARVLCFDIFCKLPDFALFLVTSAISVWPAILTTEQSEGSKETLNKGEILQTVFIYLLLRGSHTLNKTLFSQCMTVLKILCNISSSFDDIVTLGKHIVDTFEDICVEEVDDSSPEMKLKLSEATMAIELLAIQAGLLSLVKEFFEDLLMPVFTKWQEQMVHKTKKYEALITFWLKILGIIGHHCFQSEKQYLESTMKLLCELLVSSEASFTIQEGAFISVLTLEPLCEQSHLQNVSDWLLEHEQNLSDDGKTFIESINLKSVLETIPKKEQLV